MGDPHNVAIVIPFRDRGVDPLRRANLHRVLDHWNSFQAPIHVVDDGRTGTEQFNRSAAYNRGAAAAPDADVLVYTESDMLLDHDQIRQAITLAVDQPGLVVPFTTYRYLSPDDSQRVRTHKAEPADCTPLKVMDNGSSIGAVNVISRATLNAIGCWDETFQGSWYDDRAMKLAFEVCAGPTRWVDGPAHHLYHLPGWGGDHLTAADRQATKANRERLRLYYRANTPERVRHLTAGGE